MANDMETKFLQTLYDSIYEVMTASPHGKPLFHPNNTLVQLCNTGIPINPEDYEDALSLSNPSGDIAKAEKLSRMFNKVPTIGTEYVPSLFNVDVEYGKIVKSANVEIKTDPKSLEIYKKAKEFLFVKTNNPFTNEEEIHDSPIYRKYYALKSAYAVAMSKYRRSLYDPDYDPATVSGQRKFQIETPIIEAELNEAYSKMIAGDVERVEQALDALEFSGNNLSLDMLRAAREVYDKTAKDSLYGYKWHLTYAEPENWFSPSITKGFTEFKLSTEKDNTTVSTSASSYSAKAGGFYSMASGGASYSSSKTKIHLDSTKIELNFKLGTILISRPWLDMGLLKMGGWYFEKDSKNLGTGCISSGTITETNNGTMPLVPVAMIVAKDVNVSGNWSSEDISKIKKHTSAGASIGIGPFSFGGSGSHDSDDYKQNIKVDKASITTKGLQIIGWVNKVTPLCPKQ